MSSHTAPEYYVRLSPEPLSVIDDWGLGFDAGQVLKYLARAGHKKGTRASEDYNKALVYLTRLRDKAVRAESVGSGSDTRMD